MVEEPTMEQTVDILLGIRERYEQHHKVTITDEAVRAAADLSIRYITDRHLPDKAIDLIDEAASRVRLRHASAPPALREAQRELDRITKEKDAAINNQEYEEAATLRESEATAKETVDTLRGEWQSTMSGDQPTVGDEEIAQVVAMWTGIPVTRIAQEESERLLHMEDALHNRVIGQQEAIDIISKAVRRARAGLKDPKRPIGSFIFLGPTGVGKTELTKSLARFLFDDEAAMVRIDMSEYMEKHSVARLIGAPPGYVGYEEGGALTEAVRRKPYQVVLFDEIEKAHPDVFNVLLQVLDDGRLTDGQGRTVDFKNTIIIMTSNLGAEYLTGLREGEDVDQVRDQVMDVVKASFRPEFLNRVDEIILFHRLRRSEMGAIVDIQMKRLLNLLAERKIGIDLGQDAREWLAEKGYDPVYGARPLKRVIQKYLQDPLAEQILGGQIPDASTVAVSSGSDRLLFRVKRDVSEAA
jgi:ATP-dependent Clp protease ATP-binding subunit ClpB